MAQITSLAYGLFNAALLAPALWERIIERPVSLMCMQDNQATIIVAKRGCSSKLRYAARAHRVSISSIAEEFEHEGGNIEYVQTDLPFHARAWTTKVGTGP